MMETLTAIWHDPVGSVVIGTAIGTVIALALWECLKWLVLAAQRWGSTRPAVVAVPIWAAATGLVWWLLPAEQIERWLAAQVSVSRGSLVLLLVIMVTIVGLNARRLFYAWRASRGEKTRADTAETPPGKQQAPPTVDPVKFAMTSARARALLVLDEQASQRINLYGLHKRVVATETHIDKEETSRGQVQQDMEEAERAGYVSVDRDASGEAYNYKLTADGLRWVLENKRHLQTIGATGMKRRGRYE